MSKLGLPRHTDKFIAGAGAGVTAVALTYPLDTIRASLAFQVAGDTRYTGISNAAVTILKNVSSHLSLNIIIHCVS